MSELAGVPVRFGGREVTIRCDCNEATEIAEFLFRDVQALPDSQAPHIEMVIQNGSDEGSLRLLKGEEKTYEGNSAGALANILVGDTIYHLTDKCDRGLVFHSAAVSRNDKAMMLPGKSGSGKTTLTAWLLKRGFNYHTDELVFIETGGENLHAFTRPLNVKKRALPVIRDELAIDVESSSAMSTNMGSLIPHRLFNPRHESVCPPLKVVLFPTYKADAELELVHLSSAQTGLKLMQCLVNARNLEGHGFEDVSRLARVIEGYTLTYSAFEQLEDRIEEILDAA